MRATRVADEQRQLGVAGEDVAVAGVGAVDQVEEGLEGGAEVEEDLFEVDEVLELGVVEAREAGREQVALLLVDFWSAHLGPFGRT